MLGQVASDHFGAPFLKCWFRRKSGGRGLVDPKALIANGERADKQPEQDRQKDKLVSRFGLSIRACVRIGHGLGKL